MNSKDTLHDNVYKTIIEHVRDIVFILDVSGNIIQTNQTALKVYGYTAEELYEKNIRSLRAPSTLSDVGWQLQHATTKGFLFRTTHLRKDGREFPVEVNSTRVSLQNKDLIVSIVRDITQLVSFEKFLQEKEEKLNSTYQELLCAHEELVASNEELQQQFETLQMQEEKITKQNFYLQALHDTACSLMEGQEIHTLLQRLLSSAAQLVGAPHGAIYQVNNASHSYIRSHGLGAYCKRIGAIIPCDENIINKVLQTHATLIINDYFDYRKKNPGNSMLLEFSAVILIPLMSAGEIIGAISLGYGEENQKFGAEEEEILNLYAKLASVVLDNARAASCAKEELQIRKLAEEQLIFVDNKYKAIFDNASDGILLYSLSRQKILDINPMACELIGFSKAMLCSENVRIADLIEKHLNEDAQAAIQKAIQGQAQLFDYKLVNENQEPRWVQFNVKKTMIGDECCLLAIIRDSTVRKFHEETILQMAYYDAVTGLPNRRLFNERLEQELEKVQRKKSIGGTVLFMDLDDFKAINDTLGHSYGDTVIANVGRWLLETIKQNAVVARIGGDEFSVLIPDEVLPDRIAAISDSILKALNQNYAADTLQTFLSASIGIAIYPTHGTSIEELYKNADLALYKAKENRKNNWAFFQYAWQEEIYQNMLLKQELRRAITKNEIYLQYQPIICTQTQAVMCFEALVRWRHAEYGLVPPSRFIPLAEEMQMMDELGMSIISEACHFINSLSSKGYHHVTVAVNLSPSQFMNYCFAENTIEQLSETGINFHQLEFEITENLLIASLDESRQQLSKFRERGIGLALDDFGTGYSSLTYLQNLPVSKLKIDKSFIDCASSANQVRLLQSIINMAHSLNLKVVAEGVEAESQVHMIQQCSCDYIQGYFYSPPLSADDALHYLDTNKNLSDLNSTPDSEI